MKEQPAAANPGWRKSSHSGNGGGSCVEIGAIPWRTSSYSNGGGATCVEAGHVPGAVLVRDTTNRAGAMLSIVPHAWTAFLATIR